MPSGYLAVTLQARVPAVTVVPAPAGASVAHAVGPGLQLACQLVLVKVLAVVVEMPARHLSMMIDWKPVVQAAEAADVVLSVPTGSKGSRGAIPT